VITNREDAATTLSRSETCLSGEEERSWNSGDNHGGYRTLDTAEWRGISRDVSGTSQSAMCATGRRAPLRETGPDPRAGDVLSTGSAGAGHPQPGAAPTCVPLQFAREVKISPMPKDFRVEGGRILTLAMSRQATVLTALDAATFEVRKQVRGLPLVRKLFLAPNGFAVGYKPPYPPGTPGEWHFIDPELQLAGSLRLHTGSAAFAHQKHQWIIACRDGTIRCFEESGSPRWNWSVPLHHGLTSPFAVAATEERIFAAQGLYLYALTPNGRLLWNWELPKQQAQTYGAKVTLRGGAECEGARQTLGLGADSNADDVRRAYRREARLTHPDFHPHDPIAATRFRAVRDAYEALSGEGARGQGGAGALQVIFSLMMTAAIRSLSVNETFVAVGTSDGEVYVFDHDGKLLKHQADLGGRSVDTVLLDAGGMQAAFCYPRVFRFDEGSPRPSEAIAEYSGQLVACGEDCLLWYWKTMRLFDPHARVKATRTLDRKIDGVISSGTETILLSGGYLRAIPQG
jgi:hypothetical protein